MRLNNRCVLQVDAGLREETSIDRGPQPERYGGRREDDALHVTFGPDVHGAGDNPKDVLCEGAALERYRDVGVEGQRLGDLEYPGCEKASFRC